MENISPKPSKFLNHYAPNNNTTKNHMASMDNNALDQNELFLGIDVGSTTVKIVVVEAPAPEPTEKVEMTG